MAGVELFTSGIPMPGQAVTAARRAEEEGWTGITFPDSQCLGGDPYISMTVAAAATTRLRVSTGVTNPLTRHASVTAAVATTVHLVSGGRAELGIGRGDSALAHIGLGPAPMAVFGRYLHALRAYLAGEAVPMSLLEGTGLTRLEDSLPLQDAPAESRLRWVRHLQDGFGSVPLCVVATGPKALRLAAEVADRVVLAVGADPERLRWALDAVHDVNPRVKVGAYVNVVVDDDAERGARLGAGSIASFARFSVMHGTVVGPVSEDDRATLEALPGEYQMSRHFRSANQAAQRGVDLATRFAITGPPGHCVERLLELSGLGIDRFYIVGPSGDADATASAAAAERFSAEVLPRVLA